MKKDLALGLYAAILFMVYSVVVGTMLMILWNWLIPEIFNLSEISFSQSLGFIFFYYLIFNYNLAAKKLLVKKTPTDTKTTPKD